MLFYFYDESNINRAEVKMESTDKYAISWHASLDTQEWMKILLHQTEHTTLHKTSDDNIHAASFTHF